MSNAPAIPAFSIDPVASLQAICSHVGPSLDALQHLGGHVADTLKEGGSNMTPDVSALYLQAAAKHLPILADHHNKSSSALHNALLPPQQAPSGPQAMILNAASAAMQDSNTTASAATSSADAAHSKLMEDVVGALGHAAARCQPRSIIAESGIVPVLERCLPGSRTRTNTSLIALDPPLTFHADVLQVMLYAGQATHAQLLVADTWPRPSKTSSVLSVLRYFYLRGLVHVETRNWEWATRCFWTCLCIPADVTSAMVVAAWKRLVLLQAVAQADQTPANTLVPRTPKTTPNCVTRFLTQCISPKPPPLSAGGAIPAPEDASAVVGVASAASSTTPLLLHEPELALANGCLFPALPLGSEAAEHGIEASVRAYSDLVRAFVKVDKETFTRVLNDNLNHFTLDGTLPLVRLVESELVKRQIYQWSRVCSVIPLDRLSALLTTPVSEVETLLTSFAQHTQWKIQVKNGMAHFPQYEPVVDTSRHAQDLHKLHQMMQKLDVTLSTSPKFLSLIKRDGNTNNSGGDSKAPRGVEEI